MARYVPLDEPRPGALARFTVDPMWPLFALMLGGPFFSWLWSLLNSLALNGPARLRERLLLLGGFVAYGGTLVVLAQLVDRGLLPDFGRRELQLVLTVVSLVFCYGIFLLQREPFDLHEYFGGPVAPPWIGLALAWFAGAKLHALLLGLFIKAVF